MRGVILRFLAHVLALVLATLLVPGITLYTHQPSTAVATMFGVAVIFGLVNSAVKPLFGRFAASPLGLIVLAVTLLVVNAGLLLLTSWVSGLLAIPWHVDGPLPALLGGLFVSVVSFLVNSLFGARGQEHR